MTGGIEVVALCDAVGPMKPSLRRPLPETFPGTSPGDFAGEPWVLHFHCYLLRDRRGRTALVDAGIGTAGSPAESWAPTPGRLREELAGAGVAPEDVDVVILTHLHSDHAGGVTENGRPVFSGARHIVQRADLEWVPPSMREHVVTPLGDRLEAVDGEAEILPGIHVLPAPGHTPGHQIVRAGEVAVTGDLVLHPVQLADPSIRYVYDEDPDRAAATRAELLARLRAERAVLATAHFPEPFTELREEHPPGTPAGRTR